MLRYKLRTLLILLAVLPPLLAGGFLFLRDNPKLAIILVGVFGVPVVVTVLYGAILEIVENPR
jgi:hypothetical protein